jgi:hypothetical protein
MKPIDPPKTINVYMLLRRNGMSHTTVPTNNTSSISIGSGFFTTLHEAEVSRTFQMLSLGSNDNSEFFIFELELPNPVYKGT